MPQYHPRKIGSVRWVFSTALAAAFLYCLVSSPVATVAFILLFCGLFIVGDGQAKRNKECLLRLAREREGESICEFAREFDIRQVDTWIIRAVYEQLQRHLSHVHPAFPIRANDRLKGDLQLDDDDLDIDIAQVVEQRTGRSLDGSDSNPYFGKIETAADLVMFFQAQPHCRSAEYATLG